MRMSILLVVIGTCIPLTSIAEECYPVDQYGKSCLSLRTISEKTLTQEAMTPVCVKFNQYGACEIPTLMPTTKTTLVVSYEAKNSCATPFSAYFKLDWFQRGIFSSNISDSYYFGKVPAHGSLRKNSEFVTTELIADCP